MFHKQVIVLTKVLRVKKGYGAKKIITEFPRKKWSIASVNRLLRQTDSTGSADHDVKLLVV